MQHDQTRCHLRCESQPWLFSSILQDLCKGEDYLTPISKGIGMLCYCLWWMSPFWCVGTCTCIFTQWQSLLYHIHWWIYQWDLHILPKKKSDNFATYKHYEAWVGKHHNSNSIKSLHSDQGGLSQWWIHWAPEEQWHSSGIDHVWFTTAEQKSQKAKLNCGWN